MTCMSRSLIKAVCYIKDITYSNNMRLVLSDIPNRKRGFTLVELLVVIAVIVVLVAIMLPAVNIIRHKTYTATSREMIQSLAIAMRVYADEDRRRFFPTPMTGSELLHYDLADPTTVIMLLERSGYRVNPSQLGPDPDGSGKRCLMDGWHRPLRYVLDGPFISAGAIDSTRMNGTANRPAPLPDWNPKGVEPFAYLWSLGRPKSTDADDALPANAGSWICNQGSM